MPELPEVETTRRGITPHIDGQTITAAVVRNDRLRWPVPDLDNFLAGSVVDCVGRRAKYLLLSVGEDTLLIHLGMSGSLRIHKTPPPPPQKHDHIDIHFGNGVCMRYTDPRRFGAFLRLTGDVNTSPLLNRLGPEPLDDAFNAEYLYDQTRKKIRAIKTVIMDNRFVVGVGNIYASESLFRAGIHPQKACGKITRKQYEKLVSAIRETIVEAIRQGGTTLKDFTGSGGKPGYFQQALVVYGRKGQPCVHCSNPLEEVRIGQRSSCYCRFCQT